MFNKDEYWARRKEGLRGQDARLVPQLIEGTAVAPLVEVQGEKVYIPRRERRQIMLKFKRDIEKGRIDLTQLNQKRLELNRDRQKAGE